MLAKTIFAGFGGQGVLMMGYCLASSAMSEDLYTTYLPAYGAEVRGGTANCTISISDEEIASPIASSPDFLVAMNEPSLMRFQNAVKKNGVCVSNSTLIQKAIPRKDVTEYRIPVGEIAEKVGSMANMVMLGAFVAATDMVSLKTMHATVAEITAKKRKEFGEANRKGIQAGYDYVMNMKKEEGGKKKAAPKAAAKKAAAPKAEKKDAKKAAPKKVAKKAAPKKKAARKTAKKK